MGATQPIPNLHPVQSIPNSMFLKTSEGAATSSPEDLFPYFMGVLDYQEKGKKPTHLRWVTVLAQSYATSALKTQLSSLNLLKTSIQI